MCVQVFSILERRQHAEHLWRTGACTPQALLDSLGVDVLEHKRAHICPPASLLACMQLDAARKLSCRPCT